MEYIQDLIERYPSLGCCVDAIEDGYNIIKQSYICEGKLLIAGNGGSAADCEHIAGELMKRFKIKRTIPSELADRLRELDPVRGSELAKNLERPLMAIPLVAHEALTTAYMNDVDAHGVFAQQLYGYGKQGDTFLAISTSGNSQNIINAVILAKAMEIKVVGLTGQDGGELARLADVCVRVPETETYLIQELHLPIYHCWCMMLEEYFFGAD